MKKNEQYFGRLIGRHKSVVVVDVLWGNLEEATESSVCDVTTFSPISQFAHPCKNTSSEGHNFFCEFDDLFKTVSRSTGRWKPDVCCIKKCFPVWWEFISSGLSCPGKEKFPERAKKDFNDGSTWMKTNKPPSPPFLCIAVCLWWMMTWNISSPACVRMIYEGGPTSELSSWVQEELMRADKLPGDEIASKRRVTSFLFGGSSGFTSETNIISGLSSCAADPSLLLLLSIKTQSNNRRQVKAAFWQVGSRWAVSSPDWSAWGQKSQKSG